MINYCFTISDIKISLNSDYECILTDNFKPFLSNDYYDYYIEFKEVSQLPSIPKDIIYKSRSYCIASDGNDIHRYFYDGVHNNHYYAKGTYDLNNKYILIEYIPYGYRFINETINSFFHIALEAILMNEQRMILHSTCINTHIGGILFAGESGAGKSTQADLWIKYENAYLINGDKTIIYQDGCFKGYGSPYAGSSRCYRDECCDIKAIVLPKKSVHNSIRRLDTREAFKKIYSHMTINAWDEIFVNKACDFIMNLIEHIPVYELSCTKDRNAVECLKIQLLKDLYE